MQILQHLEKNRSIPLREIQSLSDILGIDLQTEYLNNKNFLHACIQANRQTYQIQQNQNLIYIGQNNKYMKNKFPYDLAIKKYFYSHQYDKQKDNLFRQMVRIFKIEKEKFSQQFIFQSEYEGELIKFLLYHKIRNREIVYPLPSEQMLTIIYNNATQWYQQQIGNLLSLQFSYKEQTPINEFQNQFKILKLNDNKIACSILTNFFKSANLPPQWAKNQSTQKYRYQSEGKIFFYNIHPALFYLIKQFYEIDRKEKYNKLSFLEKAKYFQFFKTNSKQQGYVNLKYNQTLQNVKFLQKHIVKTQIDDYLLILIIHQLGLKLTPSIIGNYVHYIYEFFSNQNYEEWCVIPYNGNVYWQHLKTELLVNVYPYIFELYIYLSQNVVFIQTIPQIKSCIEQEKYKSIDNFMSKIQNLRKKMIRNIFVQEQQRKESTIITKKELKDIFGSLYNRLTQEELLQLIFNDTDVRILNNEEKQRLLITIVANKNIQNKEQFIKLVKYLNRNTTIQLKQKSQIKQIQQNKFQDFITVFRKVSNIRQIKQRKPLLTDQSSFQQYDYQSNKIYQQSIQQQKLQKQRELLINLQKDSFMEPWEQEFDIQINQYHIIDKNDQKRQIETPNFIDKNVDWNKSIYLSPSTEIKKESEEKINNTDTTTINSSLGYSVQTFKNNDIIIDEDDNQDEQDKEFELNRNKKFLKIFKRSCNRLQKSYKNVLHQQTLKKVVLQLCENLSNINNIQQLQLYIITNNEIQDTIEQFNKSCKFVNEAKREKIYCDLMQSLYRKIKKKFKVEWKNDKLQTRIRKSSLPQTNLRRKSISYTNIKKLKDLGIQKRIDTIIQQKLETTYEKRPSMFSVQSIARLIKL